MDVQVQSGLSAFASLLSSVSVCSVVPTTIFLPTLTHFIVLAFTELVRTLVPGSFLDHHSTLYHQVVNSNMVTCLLLFQRLKSLSDRSPKAVHSDPSAFTTIWLARSLSPHQSLHTIVTILSHLVCSFSAFGTMPLQGTPKII